LEGTAPRPRDWQSAAPLTKKRRVKFSTRQQKVSACTNSGSVYRRPSA
jgi:hypothetical protein